MNWLNGFTLGLCVGTALFASAGALLRRRQLHTLEALLQAGRYRIQQADGSPVGAGELLAALGSAPAAPVRKGRIVAMFAAGLASAVIVWLALILR